MRKKWMDHAWWQSVGLLSGYSCINRYSLRTSEASARTPCLSTESHPICTRLTPTRLAPIFAFTPRTHSGSHALRICTLLLATVLPPSGTLPISLTKSAVLTTREENQEAKQDWTSLHKDRVEYALYFVMQWKRLDCKNASTSSCIQGSDLPINLYWCVSVVTEQGGILIAQHD